MNRRIIPAIFALIGVALVVCGLYIIFQQELVSSGRFSDVIEKNNSVDFHQLGLFESNHRIKVIVDVKSILTDLVCYISTSSECERWLSNQSLPFSLFKKEYGSQQCRR